MVGMLWTWLPKENTNFYYELVCLLDCLAVGGSSTRKMRRKWGNEEEGEEKIKIKNEKWE